MRWFITLLFSNICVGATNINMEKNTQQNNKIRHSGTLNNLETYGENIKETRDYKSLYSIWSQWSECQLGQKTRRKHCLDLKVCGDYIQVEVKSCVGPRKIHKHVKKHGPSKYNNLMRRQLVITKDEQPNFLGFTNWTSWSSCSRRCTTLRRRYCIKPENCGRKIIKQSAYCYLDGSYCQRWVSTRFRRRKDPGYSSFHPISHLLPTISKEDSRSFVEAPTCGLLGRYRGTTKTVMHARMRDMMKIIGGKPAPPGKWPWQVAVFNKYKEAICGGTLVSLRWVVTAAHCLRKRLYVRLGEHDLLIPGYGEVEMKVIQTVVHPAYDPETVVNDVALLRLPTSADIRLGHGVACLPEPHQQLLPHTSCIILGWGKKRPTDVHGTRILQEAEVLTIQQGICRRSYWQYAITKDMVCAGRGVTDSCAGDSGGPLLCQDRINKRYYLQGITSFGDGCGKRGKYGIYTRTAGYVTWIRSIIGQPYSDN